MMKTKIMNWIEGHPLAAFFILAYAISWGIEIPLALSIRGVIRTDIPFSLHYLAGYGPMLAAIVMTLLTAGRTGLKNLFVRMGKWQAKLVWWLIAISPLGIYLLVGVFQWSQLYLRLYQPGILDLQDMFSWVMLEQWNVLLNLGWVDFLPGLGLAALPVWLVTFGIGEETGWRGYALPRLQKDHEPLSASVILWLFWALWHLPLFFYSYDFSILPGLLTGLLAGAIALTWLYNSSGGSILIVAIWHGTFNFVTACISCKTGTAAAIMSTIVILWALVLVFHHLRSKPAGSGKDVLSTN
jgi:membrane protease YdiL (CAAX protease family)